MEVGAIPQLYGISHMLRICIVVKTASQNELWESEHTRRSPERAAEIQRKVLKGPANVVDEATNCIEGKTFHR